MFREKKNASTSAKVQFTSYQKLVIFILVFSQFTIVLDFMIISPLGYLMVKDLRMNPSEFSHVVSAYAFSAGASGFLAALFADKLDRKKLLLIFYAGFVVGTFLCAMSHSYEFLFFARVVTGIFGGVIGSIITAVVADLFTFNQSGRVMGFIMMAFSVSQVLGLPIGIYIGNAINWEAAFLMIVIVSLLMFFLIAFKLKPINAHLAHNKKENPFVHLWVTATDKNYIVGFVTIALMSIGGFMIMPFSTIFVVNNLGISQGDLPLIFMCTGIATMAVMPLMGRLSDRFNKFYLCAVMSVLCMMVVLYYSRLSTTPLLTFIGVNVALYVTLMGRFVPIQALNTSMPEVKDRGAYMSISSSLQQVSGALGAVIAGALVIQNAPDDPIRNFDILGDVLSALLMIVLCLMYVMNKIVDKKIREHVA